MSIVVVDTDVVSFIFRGHELAESYIPLIEGHQAVISFMTLAELALWPLRSNWGSARREMLREHLDENYSNYFANELLCDEWARLRADTFTAGRPIDVSDAWIAATSLLLDAPLVTHNFSHYRSVPGLAVLTVHSKEE